MPISEVIAAVAKVTILFNQEPKGSASGFFYNKGNNLFFITNRHVVIDETGNFHPDTISLQLHTDPSNIQRNDEHSLSLYKANKPCWLEHPNSKVDVVAVPVSKTEIEGRFFIKAFSARGLIPNDIDISLGEDVLVIGYPLGFYDQVHNLPIIRNATLASVFPVPFHGDPFVLIDSRLHRGTSGSPVITKPMNMVRKTDGSVSMMVGAGRTFLMGVHSASLNIKSRDPQKDEPLGLSCAWFASLIEELIVEHLR